MTTKYRVQHAAGILDGLRTVAVLVAEDIDEHAQFDGPNVEPLWNIASDMASAPDVQAEAWEEATGALTDGQKATAYLWAALDLLNLALHDSGEDDGIARVARRVAQVARAERP